MRVSVYSRFFFQQKVPSDMRISDWISDVCSADLSRDPHRSDRHHPLTRQRVSPPVLGPGTLTIRSYSIEVQQIIGKSRATPEPTKEEEIPTCATPLRSEERRVGKECVSTGRSRWSPSRSKKKRATTKAATQRNKNKK